MKHFIYTVNRGADPAMTGGGDARSWLEYYKMDNGPDVFLPFPEGCVQQGTETWPAAGDTLWLCAGINILLGFAAVTDVKEDYLNKKVEVFYDPDKISKPPAGELFATEYGNHKRMPSTGPITDVHDVRYLQWIYDAVTKA